MIRPFASTLSTKKPKLSNWALSGECPRIVSAGSVFLSLCTGYKKLLSGGVRRSKLDLRSNATEHAGTIAEGLLKSFASTRT